MEVKDAPYDTTIYIGSRHTAITMDISSISILGINPKELPDMEYEETNYELLSDEDFEANKEY